MPKPPAKNTKKTPEPEEVVEIPEPTEGIGSFVFVDGSKYDGDFSIIEGIKVREGNGILRIGNDEYEGEWKNNALNGHCKITYANGDIYEGDIVNNEYEGDGTMTFKDGASYTGNWSHGKMHGQGVFVDVQGIKWEGEFFNGKYKTHLAFITLH